MAILIWLAWARDPRPYDFVQVTQSGEWVMQLASGQTISVYVQGGHVTADIAAGLEGLAIPLVD